MTRRACKGTNRYGRPCKAPPLKDDEWCSSHSPLLSDEARFGSPVQAGIAGSHPKPRVPKITEAVAAAVERRADEIVEVYFDAIHAGRQVFGDDEKYMVITDHAVRLKAAEALVDRVAGKPRQSTELTGPEGGPITAEIVAVDAGDPATRKLAHQLLERMAGRPHPN